MSAKRWVLAAGAAFGTIFATEFVIHHVWLGAFYKANAAWWRPEAEMQSLIHFMFLAQLSLAALLTFVYAKGYETGKGGAGQGFRFGMLIGLLMLLPNTLTYYCIYPYPASLLMNWLIGGMVEITLAGTVIGILYKPER